MKSTTVRFADPVYQDLESASRLTGLPINSIVTVACLEWLRRNVTSGEPVPPPMQNLAAWRAGRVRQRESEFVRLVRVSPRPLTGGDPFWVFTSAAQDALARAKEAAERARRPWIGTSHLLQGLAEVTEGRAAHALGRLAVDSVALAGTETEEAVEQPGRLLPTRQVRRVMRRAQDEADGEGAAQIGTDHLLLALVLERDSRVAEALAAAGVTEAAVRQALGEAPPED
jgi:Clp amino terminal domain, pathogenicity island component